MPSVVIDPMESTPMPYLPASVIPDGDTIDATAHGIVLLQRKDLQFARRAG